MNMSISKYQISKYRLRKITENWRTIMANTTGGLWSWIIEKKKMYCNKICFCFEMVKFWSVRKLCLVWSSWTQVMDFSFLHCKNKPFVSFSLQSCYSYSDYLVVSPLIFIWKERLNFVITSNLVNFYFTSECLAAFLRLYLFTCNLFCFWNILLIYFVDLFSVTSRFIFVISYWVIWFLVC